ncbi:MAG: hypothetical protein ABI633_14900, partial [Burkholderiales bacterium]
AAATGSAASAPRVVAAASAPAVMPAASAPPTKPQKRPATPEEKRDSGTEPGELRPDSRVIPQINVPLNPSGAGKPAYVRPARGKAAPSGGVDDSAARCNAIADAQARKDCLDKLH